MSLYASMGIAQGALNVNQIGLNVVSNNIANMNTEGYSKQRAELSNIQGYALVGNGSGKSNYIGAGVQVDKIISYRDFYMDSSFRTNNSANSYYETLFQNAQNISTILNEYNDSGLRTAFANFYDAAQTLSTDPTNTVYRSNFAAQAHNVANVFNEFSTKLQNERNILVGDINLPGDIENSQVASTVKSLNSNLHKLADLNYKIIIAEAKGNGASDLIDERSRLIDDISSQIPITVTENTNGTVNLYMNGIRLVKGGDLEHELSYQTGDNATPAIINIQDQDGNIVYQNVNSKVDSGSLGAILEAGSSENGKLTYSNVLSQLDSLAFEFANMINSAQTYSNGDIKAMAILVDPATGETKLVESTEPMFSSSDGSVINASNIQINQNILDDPNLIAASRVDINDYDESSTGDSSNLKYIIEGRDEKLAALENKSIDDYFTNMISQVGLQSESIKTKYESQQSVTDLVEVQRQNKIGVNLDEELMDMIKYQRAYEAASRVFNTSSQLLEVLVRLGE